MWNIEQGPRRLRTPTELLSFSFSDVSAAIVYNFILFSKSHGLSLSLSFLEV